MTALDAIKFVLNTNEQSVLSFIDDMRDAILTQPTPRGGNHPLWVLGHLAVSEGFLREVILGESNPLEKWKPIFDAGSEPVSDAMVYPPYEEVLQAYKEQRARNLALLEEIGEKGLDRPSPAPPEGAESFFSTVGEAFLTIAYHQGFHGGQVADARRTAGRKPLFM